VYLPLGQPVNIEGVKCARACECDDRSQSLRSLRARESNLKLAGENPDVAVAMRFAERDDLFFERGRIGFGVGEHQLLGDGVVDSVGFDINVVIVTDNKCHLVKSTSNEQSYKIFSPN
jgi:hypothetical protein